LVQEEDANGRGIGEVDLDLSDLSDLPSQSAAPVIPTKSQQFHEAIEAAASVAGRALAATESREAAAVIEQHVAAFAERLFHAAVVQNPRLTGFAPGVRVVAFRKAPKGFYKEPAIIVQGWLDIPDRALKRTGTEIIASLSERYSGYTVSKNFLSRKLHWAQSKHLRKMLSSAGVSTKPKDCSNLSSIKRRLLDHHNQPDYEVSKPVIFFAKDGSHIIWDSKRFTVFMNAGTPTIKRRGKRIAVSTIRRVLDLE